MIIIIINWVNIGAIVAELKLTQSAVELAEIEARIGWSDWSRRNCCWQKKIKLEL